MLRSLSISLCTAILLAGCGDTAHESSSEKHVPQAPENTIVLVHLCSNYAWGIHCDGSFVDSAGDVYSFDIVKLAEENGIDMPGNDKLLDTLQEYVYEKTEPTAHTNAEKAAECWELAQKITGSEYDSEETACDMGQKTLYAVDADTHELIKIESIGDVTEHLLDDNAKQISRIWDSMLMIPCE